MKCAIQLVALNHTKNTKPSPGTFYGSQIMNMFSQKNLRCPCTFRLSCQLCSLWVCDSKSPELQIFFVDSTARSMHILPSSGPLQIIVYKTERNTCTTKPANGVNNNTAHVDKDSRSSKSGIILEDNQASYSLHCELIFSHWHAINELYGTPQPMKLPAFVYVHYAVSRSCSVPHWVIQVRLNPRQNYFKHGESTA